MVKADPSRNYYGVLNVAPNASEAEIKKAYRQLALQYHPDRNRGHEHDFVEKFQDIQAAFEVLCDSTQRAKYDADRRKHRNLNVPANTPNTPRTRPPPPSRHAYTTTTPSGSYYRAPPPKQPPPPPQSQPQRPPPPQHRSTYNTGADRFASQSFRKPPTAQRTDARAREDAQQRANVFTAWQKMKQPRAEEPRQYNASGQNTAHTTPPGTTYTNPNGAPFGRSQSTRVPSSKHGFDPSTPGVDEGQARSAYRNYARPAPTPPNASTPPSTQDNQNNDVPFSEANRVRTPYFSKVSGEKTSMFEGLGRSASVRNSPTHSHQPSPSNESGAYSDSGRRKERNSYSGTFSKPSFPHMYSDSSDESESGVFRNGSKPHGRPSPQATKPRPPPPNGFVTPQQAKQNNGASPNMQPNFRSRSEESINMKFSPSDWHGKFEGSADYFTPNLQKGSNNKGRASPTRGRNTRSANDRNQFSPGSMGPPPVSPFSQPPSQARSYPIPPPPPGPPPKANIPPPADTTTHTKFSPQYWNETFKDPHWVFTEQKDASLRRASEAQKRPKAAPRKASAPTNAGTESQNQSVPPQTKYQASAEDRINGDADAMDIDPATPPLPKATKKGTRTAPSSPRLDTTTRLEPIPNGAATAPSSATSARPPRGGLDGMAGLAEPLFGSQNGGIALDDLKSTLPFDSQASTSHPTKPNTAQKLKFPDVPFAPPPPAKVDQASAAEYFNRMVTYVKAYKKYSKSITAHFNARNTELEDLDDHFIHNRGETTRKLGFVSYLAKMKEDEEVMETWKLAQERHITALQHCEEIRNKALKMYQTLQI
ncbi:hypothetical protein ACN47E_002099 [Coniothyrium glycines]